MTRPGNSFEQSRDRRLDQVDAGRFERFHEPRGEPERDDVAVPHPLAADRCGTRSSADRPSPACRARRAASRSPRPRSCARWRRRRRCRCVLQRNAPLPAGGMRGRAGYGISSRADGTAMARSHGSQCVQSSYPVASASSISSPRKPEQSTNRSPFDARTVGEQHRTRHRHSADRARPRRSSLPGERRPSFSANRRRNRA